MKKNKLFSLFAALFFAGSAMAVAYTPTEATETIMLTKDNISACDYLSVATDNWQTNKDYGKTLGVNSADYYNMSKSERVLSISLNSVESFSVYVYNSNSGRSYTVQVGTEEAQTISHGGSGLEESSTIATNTTGEVTIKLAGTDNSVYPVAIKVNKYIPASPTLSSFTINGVEAVINEEAKTITALLPYGTTIDWGSVAVVLGGNATQWSINEGHTQLTISNENGSQKVTYTLNITVDTTVSHDATLSDITLDGISLADFASATTEYTVELAYIAKVPAIEATTTHAAATVVVDAPTLAKGETGDASITVTAQDDTTIKIYTIHFTRAAAEAAKLYEVIFSNNAKGAIDVAKQTVTVPYLADTEEAVIPTTEEKNITVKGAGATAVLNESNQIVMTSADDIEIVFTIVGAPLVPKELGNDTVTFDSTEVYIFAPAGMNKEKGYGWVANKNVEEDSNPRITSGKCRMYIALPACDSVTLFIGTTSDRKAELYVNGVDNGEVTFPKSSKYVIKKGLSNTAANFIGIENHGSGDLGFTRILLSGAKDIGSAVDQTQVEAKAVKVIRDGQLLIIRDGKVYTAQGIELQ